MNDDLHIVATTKTNFQYSYDIEVVMGLTCIVPLLEAIHAFIKFTQFVTHFLLYDFVIVVKMCCVGLYNMYSNPKKLVCYRTIQNILRFAQNMIGHC